MAGEEGDFLATSASETYSYTYEDSDDDAKPEESSDDTKPQESSDDTEPKMFHTPQTTPSQ